MVPSLLPFLEMLSDRNHELGTMSVSRVRTAALQPNSSASVPAQAPAEATVGRLLHPRACWPWTHIPGSWWSSALGRCFGMDGRRWTNGAWHRACSGRPTKPQAPSAAGLSGAPRRGRPIIPQCQLACAPVGPAGEVRRAQYRPLSARSLATPALSRVKRADVDPIKLAHAGAAPSRV